MLIQNINKYYKFINNVKITLPSISKIEMYKVKKELTE